MVTKLNLEEFKFEAPQKEGLNFNFQKAQANDSQLYLNDEEDENNADTKSLSDQEDVYENTKFQIKNLSKAEAKRLKQDREDDDEEMEEMSKAQ